MAAKKDAKSKQDEIDTSKDSKAKKSKGKKKSAETAKKAVKTATKKVPKDKSAKGDKKRDARSAKKAKKSKADAKKAGAKPSAALSSQGVAAVTGAVPEAGYPNLALCVVDALFVQRGKLAATGPVCSVVTFGSSAKWKPAPYSTKFTTADLVRALDGIGVDQLTTKVFSSEAKALGCPDLSRAQVVVELCRSLVDAGILTKRDARDPENRDAVVRAVRSTRGAGSATAARILELAAEFDFVGASWLAEHFSTELGRAVDTQEAEALLAEMTAELAKSDPDISARDVAFGIWRKRAGFSPTFRCT